ncbi:CaiB/BaiF CoA transferase family protein [Nocardia sp. alder85J]|uniref:CaiB/BaiF CoA transferase family protein n=1 Tax=Nocardia sp. alder85J TaxID=2862949 RepID=UPI001CD5D1A1|nr:CaiB/BaiF CoA-transferase family protein [Nocardia sp. alder85J]MCX4092906.1 CaiB/BaiF CoA-transferase family protein [Nocardia sp. alder85J]
MGGPLSQVKVLELRGRGPGPFGAMVLADLGADVVSLIRPAETTAADSGAERMINGSRRIDPVLRGRRTLAVDLKHPEGRATALRLADHADVLVEGNRPGVAERLGLGPQVCLDRNPRLVYARITGWGQDGPLAHTPGHDINYVALSGTLDLLRDRDGRPTPPLNLLGDYGGGGMLLVIGILAALAERTHSGRGQVVDAAMLDGIALLTTVVHGMRAEGLWSQTPGGNILDLAAPFYNVYRTADDRWVSIGCGEPRFYARLLDHLGLTAELLPHQGDPATWPAATARIAEVFATGTFEHWRTLLEDTDTCFAPVLTLDEAAAHPHHRARGTFTSVDGVVQPAPAPRFGRTPATTPPPPAAEDPAAVLRDWGVAPADIGTVLDSGAVTRG